MKTNDELLAHVQKAALDEITDLPDTPEARARTVALLEAALSKPVAAPARPGTGWRMALAASLALLLGAGGWFAARPTVEARPEVVESGDAPLTLQLSASVRVHLRPRSAVQVRDDGARVVVRRGEVAAEVISRDVAFFLETGDTEVATRLGRFRVTPGAGCDGRSQVEVTEGSVVITAGPALLAGERWPRCNPAPAPAPLAPPTPTPTPTPQPIRPIVTHRLTAPPRPEKDADRLALQNALYLQALTLQRAGDVSAAVKKLEGVLADPLSPLAETALVQKMKWLSATDRTAARKVASEYLQRFPMGFGRADAEQLVLEPQ
ncbi:MAG: FecR domain-containing protein [Archangium sp.]|nr:FecR domain-containing protein [Archangium sp.]MDP3569295.1 FecR domain-containing protein [Archangium sp.]